MIEAPLGFAFGAGMAAAFNPCGFALLPAYLSFFVGNEAAAGPAGAAPLRRVTRALAVGAAVTSGFVGLFGAAGLLITQASLAVEEWTPYIGVVLGVGLVALGIAMLRGFELKLSLPRLSKGGRTRGLGSMAAFGASYATVSLTCTLPIFLAAVSTTFDTASLASGMAAFVAYALGMGAVLTALTVAVALSRHAVIARMRSVLGWIHKVSAVLLIVAGAYVAYYGYYDIQLNRGSNPPAGPVAWVSRWSGEVSTWISDTGAVRLGIVAAASVVVAVVVSVAVGRRRLRRALGRASATTGPPASHEVAGR